jgi:putative oxidoreductase
MTPKAENYTFRIAMILVALVLLPAGSAKLAGVAQLHASFAVLGLPVWFGYFIGACEVAGAVGIFIRKLSIAAASGICVIMLGAVYFHVAHTPPAQGLPALMVLLLCLFIIVKRRKGL